MYNNIKYDNLKWIKYKIYAINQKIIRKIVKKIDYINVKIDKYYLIFKLKKKLFRWQIIE